jgi:hypothetical protein
MLCCAPQPAREVCRQLHLLTNATTTACAAQELPQPIGFRFGKDKMAYLPGFEHDIFISYSHRNERGDRWVSRFYERLNEELGQLAGNLKVWRDTRRLDGNQAFDQTIKTALENTGLLLVLNSHAFIESDYCQQEVQWFCDKGHNDDWGLQIGDRKRLFNVLLNNLPRNEWHPALSGASGFPFHKVAADDEIAFPLDPTSAKFKNSVQTLAGSLFKTLRSFRQSIENKTQSERLHSQRAGNGGDHQLPTVLLDTYRKDDEAAFKLQDALRLLNVEAVLNQSDDDPGGSVTSFEKRLREMRRMIIVFGKVQESWVFNRLSMASEIANREQARLKLGIYYAPQRSKGSGGQFNMGSLTVYQLDDDDLRNPQALAPLLTEV